VISATAEADGWLQEIAAGYGERPTKVGVSSRGELTSKLFAEHYDEPLGGSMPSSAISVVARGPVSPTRSGIVAPAASNIPTISA